MNKLELAEWIIFLIMAVFGPVSSFPDELKTDQVPIEYKHAQDIINKKQIDGKAKHWKIPYLNLPALRKEQPLVLAKPKKKEKEKNATISLDPEVGAGGSLDSSFSFYQGPPPREPNEPLVEYEKPRSKK